MTRYGHIQEDGSLKFVRNFSAPINTVWSWIVEGDKRGKWLSGGDTATHVGQKMMFEFNHHDLTPHDDPFPEKYKEIEDGVSYEVEVKEFDEPHRILWFWPDPDGWDTMVDIKLTEADGQVTLTLVQSGPINQEHLKGSSAGWHAHLDIMVDKVGGQEPSTPFWPRHEELFNEYADRLAEHLATLPE